MLEMRDSTGAWVDLNSQPYFGTPITFSSFLGWVDQSVTGFRVYLYNGGMELASAIAAVTDTFPATSITLAVDALARDADTGSLEWDATINTSTLKTSDCPTSSCQLQLVAEYQGLGETVLYSGSVSNRWVGAFDWWGRVGYWNKLIRMQARYGTVSSSWVTVTDTPRTSGITLSDVSFARDANTGTANWEVTVDFSAVDSTCGGYGCRPTLYAEDLDGTEYTLYTSVVTNWYHSVQTWSSSFSAWKEIKRLQVRYEGTSSSWTDVDDEVAASGLTLSNVVFERDQSSGWISWSADVGVSAINPNCPNYPCRPKLWAEDENGDEFLVADGVFTKFYNDTQTWGANFGQWTSIKRLQVRYLAYVSNWVQVDDVARQEDVSFTVNDFFRNSSTGYLDWAVNVNVSALDINHCTDFGGCQMKLLAVDSSGTEHLLATSSLSNWYTQSLPMSGTYSGPETIVNLRATYGNFSADWIPSSETIAGGHDLAQAATLLIGYAGAATAGGAACTLLFPIGSHNFESSLTDQDFACRSALAVSGTPLRNAVISVLAAAGTLYTTQLLTALGLNRPATGMTSTGALPGNCSWVNLEISCYSAGTTTVTRPDDAPPAYDPTYEDNLYENSNLNDPVQPGVLVAVAVGVALAEEVRKELLRSCVAQVTKIDAFSGLPAGTEAGLTADDCGTKNIFFVGEDLPEPTAHDIGVISTSPDLMLLTYASTAEKGTKPDVRNLPGCVDVILEGEDCDEYPFWATEENTALTPPDVIPMDPTQNQLQGSRYSAFIGKCKLVTYPRNSAGRKFLVVYSWLLPTGGLCGTK